ncbi:hypothetical protein TUMSATVNIG1_02340 [Vibrio nigripulchritudo]|uniref:hypothetical protein n=1 Tax=Vibrio nigripulchritudo TaxID=28173 RepID=UPI00190E086F|nr:hypothetical protein [Vibrio nigripulchritudo]BCL68297.1 hypothetical protein VNTUMSATTG_02340 [Vibrio nigripulchritudo]BDU29625.1 hypothetical protein TUMSATVNIG1_02340 [Vibrio nigripulchritudo]
MLNKKTMASLLLVGLSTTLVGCATVQGTVTENQDGTFNSFFSDDDKSNAMKVASSDTKATCEKRFGENSHPLVINQDVKTILPEEIKTGNQVMDSLVKLGQTLEDPNYKATYEVTTQFKCSA